MALALVNFRQLVSGATFLAACVGSPLLFAESSASPARTCAQVLALYKIGAALTVAEIEATSLKKMKGAPSAPQVPFGHSNKEWLTLKALMQPGDTLHEFTTDDMGGHLVVRNGCKIGQIISWIR